MNLPGVEFLRTISKLEKKIEFVVDCFNYVLTKKKTWAVSRSCRAKTTKKCTKKVRCTCEVVNLPTKPLVVFDVLVAVASSDRKVPSS